jgi:hypothetical protein
VFFGKGTVYRFSIFGASERIAYDEKIRGSVAGYFLDKI